LNRLLQKFTVLRGAPRELWIIYLTKVLEIVAYGLMSSTLVLWLSSDLDFSDAKAGDTIAIWSTILTLVTVLVGSLVDSIGIRKSFLLGFWLCLVPRGFMTVSDHPWISLGLGLFPMAIGLALMVPVMNAAIKRYSTTAQQTMAFAVFYTVMNVGFAIAGWLFDWVREILGEYGTQVIWGMELSTYRVLFFWATVATIPGLIITHLWLRPGVDATEDGIVINPPVKKETGGSGWVVSMFKSIGDAGRDTVNKFVEVWKQPTFYRFLTFLFLIVMIRIVFYHMHYTFPKYGIRELGPGAKIGNLWSVLNPVMIVVLTPLVAAFTGRISSYSMIAVGSSFAAIPVFFLAVPRAWFQGLADGWLGDFVGHSWLGLTGAVDPIYISITLFVFFFSIGEAIWSPRLYQYTAAIAPKGQEGTYMALSLLPYFVAKLGVGLMSGRMLEKWCPSDGALAQKHLISEYGMKASDFEGKNLEEAVPVLGEKLGYTINEAGLLTQEGFYAVWELLHETYPRDSETLWLWIAIMALTCPIGILLLRKFIRSREEGATEGPEQAESAVEVIETED
jgi:MFS family permease